MVYKKANKISFDDFLGGIFIVEKWKIKLAFYLIFNFFKITLYFTMTISEWQTCYLTSSVLIFKST
jgi:hypothetical protein